jgi:tetratricopeptide (TPR) repeat protein
VLIVDEPSGSPALPSADEQILTLLAEADAREGAGDYEGALSALAGVLEFDANHVAAHERMKDIYIAADRRVDAVKELLWLSSSCEELNHDRAVHYARAAYELAPRSEATRRRLGTLGVRLPSEGDAGRVPARARATPDVIDAELDAILPPISSRPGPLEASPATAASAPGELADLLDVPMRPEEFSARPPPRRAGGLARDTLLTLLEQPIEPDDFAPRAAAQPERVSPPATRAIPPAARTSEPSARPAERPYDDAPSVEFSPIGTSEVSVSEPPRVRSSEPSSTARGQSARGAADESDSLLLPQQRAHDDQLTPFDVTPRPGQYPDEHAPQRGAFAAGDATSEHAYGDIDEGPDPTVPGGPLPDLDMHSGGYELEPSRVAEPPRSLEAALESSLEGAASDASPAAAGRFEAPARAEEPTSGARAVETVPVEIQEVLDEAEFFASQNMFDEALELINESILIYPKSVALKQRLTQYEAKADQKERAEFARDRSDDSFDIAEQLANDLVAVDSPADDDDMIDVESVFAQFKKGVAEQVAPDDSETHFDLGIAYKEMGLVEDAVREFELAGRGKKRACTALTMIGICHLERGQTQLALSYFERALNNENRSDPEELALQFEIGNAHEKLGQLAQALAAFESVAARDRTYRGVSARLEQLKQRGVKSAGAGR